MFIKIGERRINIDTISEYKPYENVQISYQYYYVSVKYLNKTTEDISFCDPIKRDNFLNFLDKNLLINNEV
jgi:hypothetical protein